MFSNRRTEYIFNNRFSHHIFLSAPVHTHNLLLLHRIISIMFKSAVVATVLLQASATKIESYDHNTKAINPQMVESINVSELT